VVHFQSDFQTNAESPFSMLFLPQPFCHISTWNWLRIWQNT